MSFWKEIPWQMKALWALGLAGTIAFWTFIIWVIIKLLQHWSII